MGAAKRALSHVVYDWLASDVADVKTELQADTALGGTRQADGSYKGMPKDEVEKLEESGLTSPSS